MEDLIGVSLNRRYTIFSVLGQNAYSTVYLAKDLRRKTDIAVKLIDVSQDQRNFLLQSLKQDVARLRNLNHPAIVRYYGIEDWQGYPIIVMDYISGKHINDYYEEIAEPISKLREVTHLYYHLCSLLAYVHSQGILHAFLRPSNVYIKNAQLIITDLLISKTLHSFGYTSNDQEQQAYLAPELIRWNTYTNLCDIYSVGVILYEVLTTSTNRNRSDQKEINSLQSTFPWGDHSQERLKLALTVYPKQIAARLCTIIRKCTALDPAERYRSAAAIYEDLQAVVNQIDEKAPSHNHHAETIFFIPKAKRTEHQTLSRTLTFRIAPLILIFVLISGSFFALLNTRIEQWLSTNLLVSTVDYPEAQAGFPLQTLPLSFCQDIFVDGYPVMRVRECLTGVRGLSDGRFVLDVSFTAYIPSDFSVTIRSDQGNSLIYVLDDQGNRYNQIQAGAEFAVDKELENGESKTGWYIFPALAETAKYIIFHDDDNGLVFPPIHIPGR